MSNDVSNDKWDMGDLRMAILRLQVTDPQGLTFREIAALMAVFEIFVESNAEHHGDGCDCLECEIADAIRHKLYSF